jgi:hypothetical protein
MEFRTCKICGIEKELSDDFYYKSKGLFRHECILCTRQNRKDHYLKIQEGKLIYNKQYFQENKENIRSQRREYRTRNKEKTAGRRKVYYQENKANVLAKNYLRHKIRIKKDPIYRMRKRMSSVIGKYLKKSGGSKIGSSILEYLTYSFLELKIHLEAQFEPWMTWNNHGKYNPTTWDDGNTSTWTWNIDHIIPQSKLPYSSMTDDNFKKCWSLENLRPLASKQNIVDGNRRVYL